MLEVLSAKVTIAMLANEFGFLTTITTNTQLLTNDDQLARNRNRSMRANPLLVGYTVDYTKIDDNTRTRLGYWTTDN